MVSVLTILGILLLVVLLLHILPQAGRSVGQALVQGSRSGCCGRCVTVTEFSIRRAVGRSLRDGSINKEDVVLGLDPGRTGNLKE